MYRNTGKAIYSLVLQEVKGLTKKMHIPNVYCYDFFVISQVHC